MENGFLVVVPVLLDHSDRWSGIAGVAFTNQPHREWIYRQAFHLGRHPIGYEVQKVLAVVDWFRQRAGASAKIGVAGYGEGGLVAFHAAASDPRLAACLVSGYFDARPRPWEEPLYCSVWGLLDEFGDAEIATLIAPCGLVVEYSKVPAVNGPPPLRPGRRSGAAGKLSTPAFASVQAEFQRIAKGLPSSFQTRHLVAGPEHSTTGPLSVAALTKFARLLGVATPLTLSQRLPTDRRRHFDPAARQRRQVKETEGHVQMLVRTSGKTRDRFFSLQPASGPGMRDRFFAQAPKYRAYLWKEVLGKFDDPLLLEE